MTKQEDETVFRSNRTAVTPAPGPEAAALPRAIVLSETRGLAEIVARGINTSGETQADHIVMCLPDFAKTPDLSLDEVMICLFEIKQGDDAQLAALRNLTGLGSGKTKFLGITSEVLTLSTARQLMDAGVDDVVPIGTYAPGLSHAAPLAGAAEAARRGSVRRGLQRCDRGCGPDPRWHRGHHPRGQSGDAAGSGAEAEAR